MKEEMKLQPTLTVKTREKGGALGDLFGVFFEDLNHAADGGLYGELVQNRSFEFEPIDNASYNSLTAWEKVERGNGKGNMYVEDSNPVNNRNIHYAVIDVLEAGEGVGLKNLGYNTGIPVNEGKCYKFSFYARKDSNFKEPIDITLENADGKVHGKASISIKSSQWEKYETKIKADATDYSSCLVITTKGKGKLYLDMISLFPENTFNNRTNGMREDIAELIADMKPKFMRFPGGCLVHDGALDSDARDSMYRWKNTLGDIAQRPARRNNWGYNQTLGIGYYEYFCFCEDIGAKPLPVLPAGYNPHRKSAVSIDELRPWIDDALDLIEFANGHISTEWGRKRAELGHAEPFGLEYIAIGNEEVGEPFFERYTYFHKAIKDKYPDIKIINSSGPFAAGGEYERGWKSARENKSDLVDEHYYQAPEWFLANHHRYDDFKGAEPKVFLGEYASWGNTYYNALVEASYMIGLERNAHAVALACYAPMLCNVDYINWKPDMIWFNNHQAFGSANYYVQKLFMHHQGDNLLKINAAGLDEPQKHKNESINGKISIAVDQVEAEFYDIKVKNEDTGEERKFNNIFAHKASEAVELFQTDCENYSISLKARRKQGEKGFFLYFGEKDQDNRLRWEIGGWQNQDSIVNSFVSGRGSCLTQSMFTLETDKEYSLHLKVQGRSIFTYIDGKLINEAEAKPIIIEPLYYSASVENHSEDIIIKVVNIQKQPVRVDIVLEGDESKNICGTIYEMCGYNDEAENNFEEPELVVPREKTIELTGNTFTYCFEERSLTIFRIKKS